MTSTVTITPGVAKRQVTITASDVPAYASACSGAIKYASACSCIGVSAVTITAQAPSTTITVSTYTTATSTLDETTTVSTTVSTTLPPTPVSTPFTLQIEDTGTFYDGFDLEFDGCSGSTGHPYLYYGGSDTSFVFGSDGFLHVESCFNVIAGTFHGSEPGFLYVLNPEVPGNGGFVGALCSDAGEHLACTGSNGETVFYLPDYSSRTVEVTVVPEGAYWRLSQRRIP